MNPAQTEPQRVASALEKAGCSWMLRWTDRDAALQRIGELQGEFAAEYERRYHERPDALALAQQNPVKAAAFFQALGGRPLSLEMRILAWRLILGSEILRLDFSYARDGGTEIRVTVRSPCDVAQGEFSSDSLWDFAVLRHLGMLTIDGKPVLDGYFALRIA